jgi:hypothetical protein
MKGQKYFKKPFTVLLIYSEWIRYPPFTVVADGGATCRGAAPEMFDALADG